MVVAADKCGPGAYNLPFYSVLCDPMHNGGLLLNPKLNNGFRLQIIDMDCKDGDRIITLDAPERIWDIAALLRDQDRYAIEAAWSRHAPDEQLLSVSATRLHNIAGKYTGKDDPIAVFRTQGIFPAPEEVLHPWMLGHFVTGDCRGSHVAPIMPVPINTAVDGAYCLPIVSCLAFSMDARGKFTHSGVDLFGGKAWDWTRTKVQQKFEEWRRQGFFGPTMASRAELAYTGLVEKEAQLDKEFALRRNASPQPPKKKHKTAR
jgi:fructose 1,6-bisphosphate aldolase/phosphatase